jgi:2-phospho-L-lactate guanylyltransferase
MQATVHRFDPATHDGALLTDDGLVLRFDADAFSASGLRHLRVGQRLTVRLDEDGRVAALRLGTVGAPTGQISSP